MFDALKNLSVFRRFPLQTGSSIFLFNLKCLSLGLPWILFAVISFCENVQNNSKANYNLLKMVNSIIARALNTVAIVEFVTKKTAFETSEMGSILER